jgi:hypothetical protein
MPCADANTDYIRANNIVVGRHGGVRVPVQVLRAVLSSVPPEVLAVAEAGLGRRTVAALLAKPRLRNIAADGDAA